MFMLGSYYTGFKVELYALMSQTQLGRSWRTKWAGHPSFMVLWALAVERPSGYLLAGLPSRN
jgi:hypothetical protein